MFAAIMFTRFAGFLLFSAMALVSAAQDDGKLLANVLGWTRSNGGFISDKVEIKQISGDLYGLYATEAVEEGEVLTDIPWKLVMQPKRGSSADWCERVGDVRDAITKRPEDQSPYEIYLARRSRGHVPQFWSKDAIEILLEAMADCFPKYGLIPDIKKEWSDACGKEADEETLTALMLLQTRGEGPYGIDFVPVHDLLNHRVSFIKTQRMACFSFHEFSDCTKNGHHTNVDPEYNEGQSYRILATRQIEPGEQLQNSYNQCQWCHIYKNPASADWFQVTPHIFELYGFIEFMPQRWVIPHVRLFFDIDEVDEEDTEYPGELEVEFVVPPSSAGLHFLYQRLVFLQQIKSRVEEHQGLSQNEKDGLFTFLEAVIGAFSAALYQGREEVSDSVWSMGSLWYFESNHTPDNDENEDDGDNDDEDDDEDEDEDDEDEDEDDYDGEDYGNGDEGDPRDEL